MVFRLIRSFLGWLGRTPDPVPAKPVILAVERDTPPQQAIPFDEGLLERARMQWQFGDWSSLASLSRETLQHHPDRAKLALLAAAGHQQTGDSSAARALVRLAQDWGCNRHLIAQVLLAGVHNTLAGAAALGGQGQRALGHFQASIATGMPGADVSLATQGRIAYQWQSMQLPGSQPALSTDPGGRAIFFGDQRSAGTAPLTAQVSINPALTALEKLTTELQQQREELAAQAKTQKDDLIRVRKHLEGSLRKEVLNATKQLEAFLNVQSALAGGDLIPGLHGWPISPDLAAYLIELIRAHDYDLVIEFGSGTSTVVMAKALALTRQRREGKAPVEQIAFEHLEAYHTQTNGLLRSAGLAEAVTVHLTPLAPYQAVNGKTYPYYTCQPVLEALKSSHDSPTCRALVLVDGPPASTGEHARYPAISAVMAALPHAALDILLDDLIREDEQQVARMWQDDLKTAGREAAADMRKMEKDACLIRVEPRQPTAWRPSGSRQPAPGTLERH
jgi:hypothetical protein